MNFKEKLTHIPLSSESHCFPSIEHLLSLGQDFLGNELCLNDSKNVCTPCDLVEVKSILNPYASQVPPP